MTRIVGLGILLVAVGALLMAGCGDDSGGDSGADGPSGSGASSGTEELTVGFVSAANYTGNMPVLIGIEQGIFEKQGLKVETVEFNGGSDAVKALVGGSVDVVDGTGFDVVGAQAKGLDVKAFYAITQESDFALFANKKLGVRSFADLEGESVAISAFGSYTDFLTRQTVAAADLPADSITPVPRGTTAGIVGAVTRGAVAGAWGPAAWEGLFEGKANVVGPATDLGIPSQYSTLMARGDFLESNAQALRKLTSGVAEAIRWHQANRDEAIALAMKRMSFPEPVAAQSYDLAEPIYTPEGDIDVAGLEAMAAAVPELELGPSAPSVDEMHTAEHLPGRVR
jgi:NitT/TauT family transport system substrate-binding protein